MLLVISYWLFVLLSTIHYPLSTIPRSPFPILKIKSKVFFFLLFVYAFIEAVVKGGLMSHAGLLFIQLDQVIGFQDLLPKVPVVQVTIQDDFIE